jgi:NAD(P)-dependent dehydrogenase (short-subunit alcohol dehydrogenase family)
VTGRYNFADGAPVGTDDFGFDGRVAIVTGAGRGLGRAYARLLAARGASVVVNDLGGSMAGEGADPGPAAAVADEITAAGGVAVADGHDITDESGATALVDVALDRFGRLDALVNNAGIMRWATMPEVDADALDAHLAVHVTGAFLTTRAAWPRMVQQGYGRVVLTTSAGMLGHPGNLAYAAAKGATVGMMRSLATAGAPHGIRVNCIAPAAYTRMAGTGADPSDDDPMAARLAPELAAPMVAFLAHEACPVSGEVYAAGAGRFARLLVATNEGYVHTDGAPTVEDVAAQWSAIHDPTVASIPRDLTDWSTRFTAHLAR